jgi:hypothetical protein
VFEESNSLVIAIGLEPKFLKKVEFKEEPIIRRTPIAK